MTRRANAASPLILLPLLKYNIPRPFLIGKLPPKRQAPTKIATVHPFKVALLTSRWKDSSENILVPSCLILMNKIQEGKSEYLNGVNPSSMSAATELRQTFNRTDNDLGRVGCSIFWRLRSATCSFISDWLKSKHCSLPDSNILFSMCFRVRAAATEYSDDFPFINFLRSGIKCDLLVGLGRIGIFDNRSWTTYGLVMLIFPCRFGGIADNERRLFPPPPWSLPGESLLSWAGLSIFIVQSREDTRCTTLYVGD